MLQEGSGRQLQEAIGEIGRLTQLLDSQGYSAQQQQQAQCKLQVQVAEREEQFQTLTSQVRTLTSRLTQATEDRERVNELLRKMREMEEREARLLHDARFASQLQAALEEQIQIKEAAISDMALAISESQNKIISLEEMIAIKMQEERAQKQAHTISDPGSFLSDIARASLQDQLARREAEIEHLNEQLSVLPDTERRMNAKEEQISLLVSQIQELRQELSGAGAQGGDTLSMSATRDFLFNLDMSTLSSKVQDLEAKLINEKTQKQEGEACARREEQDLASKQQDTIDKLAKLQAENDILKNRLFEISASINGARGA